MTEDFIFGKNTIIEALNNYKERINKILISKNINSDVKVKEILDLAKVNKIAFQFVPKEKFIKYKDFNHQGIVAFVSPIEYKEIDDLLQTNDGEYKKVIILDGVEDPHNIGAIIRTAVCAGFDAIIIPQHRGALINSTVEKTSVGAVNNIDIVKVNSLLDAVKKLKDNNYWVIAADAHGKDNYFQVDYKDMNLVLIMGAEHAGVSKTLLKQSDFIVKIPMLNKFNSLNVSVSAGILIYEIVKQCMPK
ncbi:23S rRNA (guanosine(2251)-2'-O)-methyltransferase RlmB [bacterium]|nr:23S rRNA (guanosine(2251)-2'-O)-methyltransferase RlmB [bacterium]